MDAKPYFTIVIPAYNREREILRAVDSCLAQPFVDHEVVVVDDGSTDRTAALVESRRDPRVRLIRHPANRGVCPARNTGVRASRGSWIMFLDSDHEMRLECLSRAFEATSSAGADVHRLGFMCDFDDGRISPWPLPPDHVLDYTDWLRWIDQTVYSDALWVTRRHCFDVCMMPETFALELSYHLDFAKAFRSRIVRERLVIEHTDSGHRLTFSSSSRALDGTHGRRLLDQTDDWTALLANHGKALSQYAPRRYRGALRHRVALRALAGHRLRALATAAGLVRSYPWSAKNWALLLLVLLGPHAIRRAIAYNERWGSGPHARSISPDASACSPPRS
jgi:glycosyltransferase involved in cell wall biosynthesis